MAKDTRIIVSSVRMPGRSEKGRVLSEPKTFGPGQEDELNELLTPEQGDYLRQQGVIDGDWNFKGGRSSAESTAPETTPAPSFEEQAESAAGFVSSNYGFARNSTETASDYLQRLVDAAQLTQEVSQRNTPAMSDFEIALRAKFRDDAVVELMNSPFNTPALIDLASDEQLDSVKGWGLPKIAELRAFLNAPVE